MARQIHGMRDPSPPAEKLILPKGAVPVNVNERNQQVYSITRRVLKGKKPKLDKDGNVQHRVNRLTGEQMHQINEPIIGEETLLFTIEHAGPFNLAMVPYIPPSPEELAERDRQEKIARMKDQLAEAVVDMGLTPEELIRRLAGGATEVTAGAQDDPEPEPDPKDETEYPDMYGPGMWHLDAEHRKLVEAGEATAFKGKREEAEAAAAERAERRAEEAEAKAVAEKVPEL